MLEFYPQRTTFGALPHPQSSVNCSGYSRRPNGLHLISHAVGQLRNFLAPGSFLTL
jgi:hypothetical protein